MEVSSQVHAPAALPSGRVSSIYYIGVWVGPRAGLDAVEKKKPLAHAVNRTLGSVVIIPTEQPRF
jgi:hypothetical protein